MSIIRSFRPLHMQFLFIWPVTALLFAISPLLAPGSISGSSMLTVFSFASILAIAAIGQTLVIQHGGLDLTVPGVISLAAVLVTKYPAGDNALLLPWALAALGAGVVSGLVCGIAVTRFRVTPFVATLAVNALLYGTVLHLTKGTSTHEVPSLLGDFAVGRVGGIPNLAFVAVAAIIIVEVIIRYTAIGRRFVAIGASNRAARAAGMRVDSYRVATYVAAGASYAFAGILLAGYLGIPSLLVGNTYLLPTITVVVLGGTSLLGGAGSVAATAVGAVFLTQLQQVTIGMGASTSAQFIIQAVIIALGMGLRLVPWSTLFGRRAMAPATQLSSGTREGAS
ncbi:MAG: ABC transporter permease [Bauldia sp.]|nr:ABC transporter permease [Bauldia sp.]